MNSSDRERLAELLEQKLSLFTELCGQCEDQTKLLEETKLDELNTSLNDSQKQREKINGLQQELESLMQSYALLPEDMRDDRIDKLIYDIGVQIERCANLNEQNMITIKRMTEEQSKKIDDQSAKRKGITGYAQNVTRASEMIDKKS